MGTFRALFLACTTGDLTTEQIWVTDGTAAGTQLLGATGPANSNANLPFAAALGTSLYFTGYDAAAATHLYVTDGTAAGTQAVTVTGGEIAGGFNPTYLGTFENAVWLTGRSAAGDLGLWKVQGTMATQVVAQISPGSIVGDVNGTIYSAGYAPLGASNQILYRIDNGTTGTALTSLPNVKNPVDLVGLGTKLFFHGDDASFNGIFCYDTILGTVTELTNAGGTKPTNPTHLTAFGNYVYFESGSALWRTDGTTAGTSTVTLPGVLFMFTGLSDIYGAYPMLGGKMLLEVLDSSAKYSLVLTDGTAAGTTKLTLPAGGPSGLTPLNLSSNGSEAVFTGYDGTNRDVYHIDGTTLAVTKITPAGMATTGALTPVLEAAFTVECFQEGTLIATANGAVSVEDLREGDRVITADGVYAPIMWIGHRRIDCTRHPHPERVWPVRVEIDTFAPDSPARPLYLSPDHAVFVDDVLIPIKHLVNGSSIAPAPRDEVTYYHIELATHELLLAEGVWAESYLDANDRSNFANGGDVLRLFPDFSARKITACNLWEASGRAALVIAGPKLEAARRRINARAASMSRATASEDVLTA